MQHGVIVACDQRQVTFTQTLDVVNAAGVVRAELCPVAVCEALGGQRVHVTRVDVAQKRRNICDFLLRQQPAAYGSFTV